MEYTTMGEAGFDCFRKFFRFINMQESKLRTSGSDTVVEFDMFGLDRYPLTSGNVNFIVYGESCLRHTIMK
jgi:hypothetical protein